LTLPIATATPPDFTRIMAGVCGAKNAENLKGSSFAWIRQQPESENVLFIARKGESTPESVPLKMRSKKSVSKIVPKYRKHAE